MSASSSQSGLGTFKRNWSDNSAQSQGTEPIEWPPSPEVQRPPPRELTAYEKRLRAIEAGLASAKQDKAALVTSRTANSQSSSGQKRPSAEGLDGPAAKKRVLPPSFSDLTPRQAGPSRSSISQSTVVQVKVEMSKSKPAKVFLSTEQLQILKLVEQGNSVFYTGSAGTGKSVLLREIIKTLRKKFSKSGDAVAITASTGIAACNIGGVTLHSFAGIGLGIESAEELASKIKKNKKSVGRWLRTQVLIIDEVSMVDGDLFDKLARIGSILRRKTQPFGGIQLVVTGDFFQLPPVTKSGNPKFAFEAQLWGATIQQTFNLTKVFRQKDQEFVDMLNEMRFGQLSKESIDKFHALNREIEYDDGIGPTELFPRREDVDRSNQTRMTRIHTEEQVYRATDGGSIQDRDQRDKMLANFMAPQVLRLKIDSQVMLIKNMDDMLVNGSMGKVVRFQDPATYKEDLTNGGAADEKKKKTGGTGALLPVVAFHCPGGVIREIMVQSEVWKVELPNGEVQVSRSQLPLILSWAMSIHKSQGQTLERVKVDLGKVFEKGQAYVALSRATSLQGLQVLNFNPSKVNAHPKVTEWSKTLQTIT